MVKKHILDIDEETWNEVLKYKIDHTPKDRNVRYTVNDAVVSLIKLGLKSKKS